ncbi:MAG: tetratricopeptide repeat protein [Steroidobacteraceae bacterium]
MKTSYRRAGTFIVLAMVASARWAQAGSSLPGETTATPELERDTLFMVMGMDRAEDKECDTRKVVARSVISANRQKAVEEWLVDRCGTIVRYRIEYESAPGGGTTVGVNPGQVVDKAEPNATASAPAPTGFDAAVAAYTRGDYATALREFRPIGEQGNGWAQGFLGVMYASGEGVEQDYAEAARWYRLAAEQGLSYSQYNLGFMYANGQGVAQDYVQAYTWYALAAANEPSGELHDVAARDRDDVARKMTPAQIAQAEELVRNFKPRQETGAER